MNDTSTPPAKRAKLTLREPLPRLQPDEPDVRHYFYVWSPQRTRPRKRHATSVAAAAEARRLSELHPGVEFIAYEARAIARRVVEVDE